MKSITVMSVAEYMPLTRTTSNIGNTQMSNADNVNRGQTPYCIKGINQLSSFVNGKTNNTIKNVAAKVMINAFKIVFFIWVQ